MDSKAGFLMVFCVAHMFSSNCQALDQELGVPERFGCGDCRGEFVGDVCFKMGTTCHQLSGVSNIF